MATAKASYLRQGEDYIIPITTADQVILRDGSRLEKDGKIVADDLSSEALSKLQDGLKSYVEDTLLNATW